MGASTSAVSASVRRPPTLASSSTDKRQTESSLSLPPSWARIPASLRHQGIYDTNTVVRGQWSCRFWTKGVKSFYDPPAFARVLRGGGFRGGYDQGFDRVRLDHHDNAHGFLM